MRREGAVVSESRFVERLGQWLFLLMCAAVAAAAINQIVLARSAPPPPAPRPVVESGTTLTLPAATTGDGTANSLLLVLSVDCRFCTESMPFYRRLAARPEVQSGRVRLSVVSMQPLERMREYLREHDLAATHVMSVPESGLRVGATPGVVLATKEGVVRESWLGAVPPREEKRVIDALTALANNEEGS